MDTEYEVNRWRRFGMDRLYVSHPDGTKVGWWDLLTDEAHPEEGAEAHVIADAVHRWRATADTPPAAVAAPTPQPESAPEVVAQVDPVPEPAVVEVVTPVEPVAPERPWVDLSAHVAGAAVSRPWLRRSRRRSGPWSRGRCGCTTTNVPGGSAQRVRRRSRPSSTRS